MSLYAVAVLQCLLLYGMLARRCCGAEENGFHVECSEITNSENRSADVLLTTLIQQWLYMRECYGHEADFNDSLQLKTVMARETCQSQACIRPLSGNQSLNFALEFNIGSIRVSCTSNRTNSRRMRCWNKRQGRLQPLTEIGVLYAIIAITISFCILAAMIVTVWRRNCRHRMGAGGKRDYVAVSSHQYETIASRNTQRTSNTRGSSSTYNVLKRVWSDGGFSETKSEWIPLEVSDLENGTRYSDINSAAMDGRRFSRSLPTLNELFFTGSKRCLCQELQSGAVYSNNEEHLHQTGHYSNYERDSTLTTNGIYSVTDRPRMFIGPNRDSYINSNV